MKIKSGSPLHLEAPFEAEPQPVIAWQRDDCTLKAEDGREIDVKENFVSLHIFRSERADTGQYTLTLRNEFGEDKAKCNVIVLGKTLSLLLYLKRKAKWKNQYVLKLCGIQAIILHYNIVNYNFMK